MVQRVIWSIVRFNPDVNQDFLLTQGDCYCPSLKQNHNCFLCMNFLFFPDLHLSLCTELFLGLYTVQYKYKGGRVYVRVRVKS